MHDITNRPTTTLLSHLPEELVLCIFGFLDGSSLASSASVNSRWHQIASEKHLWGRLCIQSCCIFSHMDQLIINYIPGIWGRIFYAHTTRSWNDLTALVEHTKVDLKTLFTRLWAAQQNRCGFCFKHAPKWHLNHLLIKICATCCKNKQMFITKTEAKKNYFLNTEEEFDKLFCFISHNRKYYLMADVKRQAVCKYGDEKGLERRHREYTERSNKIKQTKEVKHTKRELGRTTLVGVTKDRLKKMVQRLNSGVQSEERVKLSLLLLGFMKNSPAIQLFNVNASCHISSQVYLYHNKKVYK